jgi:hypothetical protein
VFLGFLAFLVFIFLIFGFVPKVGDTENTDLLKKGKKRDLRPTQRSGATETVASDVSVGRLRSSAKRPFFDKSINLMITTDIWDEV